MATTELRTSVYVDGFNLYYRALRGTTYKWLNLHRLCEQLLSPQNRIVQIRYFTAPVTGKQDPDAPIRQQQYLRALKTIPHCTIHYGSFLARVENASAGRARPRISNTRACSRHGGERI